MGQTKYPTNKQALTYSALTIEYKREKARTKNNRFVRAFLLSEKTSTFFA